jgi:hypothetical protein
LAAIFFGFCDPVPIDQVRVTTGLRKKSDWVMAQL